ncbi:hypothetical protein BTO06_03165 [Tenacibaculum sp. SZ-18]|uniref:hypothetical protein n=1 Tax=Tenacibaculum sp. SZ-18 TaxID=754423 RepID=UPI000C2D5B31|nr:hypothetical protein [Tenacibaculum sp. SZ-18]AUC14206.1 hypothetical protein BTO06_03165 [Tenacibaculum sp. SZ-18]
MFKIIGFLLSFTLINAQKDIDNSIDLNHSDPKSSHHYYSQGKNFAKNGLHLKAIENFNSALELTTKSDTLAILIKNEIGNVYFSMKNYADSKKLKFLRGKGIRLELLGNVEEKAGNYLEALKLQK